MTDFVVPDLKFTHAEGRYARGNEGVEQILRAALMLLVEQGYGSLTMRAIAKQCGMKLGNVTYYFPTKEDLVRDMLEAIIGAYQDSWDEIMHEPGASAEERLERYIVLILEDIKTKKTTRVFPELWVLSNHDPFILERVEALYARARVMINELIAELNPALPVDEREALALFISASMEGLTVFAGYQKPWTAQMPWLEKIACKSFVELAKTLKPGEIKTVISKRRIIQAA